MTDPAQPKAPKNVLLLTVDTWRADRMSVYGYERPTTPALERFAKSAQVCTNAFTIGPFTQIACVPLFTSSRPLSYGGYDDGARGGRPNTIFKQFKQAGHATWGLSTMHWISSFFGYLEGFDEAIEIFLLNAIPGMACNMLRDPLRLWHEGSINDAQAIELVSPPILKTFDNIESYCNMMLNDGTTLAALFPDCKALNDGYDFSRVLDVVAHHRREFANQPLAYLNTHFQSIPQPHEWIARDWRYKRGVGKMLDQAYGRVLSLVSQDAARLRKNRFGMSPDAHSVADAVVNAISGHQANQPFLIWAHFKDTHQPFVSGRGRNWFKQTPRYLESLGLDPTIDPGQVFKERPKTAEDWQKVNALYDCAMRSTDEAIGRILNAIDDNGLRANTVVGMAGDHGEEIGEHGDYGHTVSAYEHTSHIPMMFRDPDRAADRIDGLTSSLDFAPTIAEMAGIVPDPDWEGQPVTDPTITDRNHILMEALCRGTCLFEHRPPYLAIRTKQYKYLWREYRDPFLIHGEGGNELFDLTDDPEEARNIYQPDHPTVVELNGVLATRLAEISEISDQRIIDAFGDIGQAAIAQVRGSAPKP